MLDTVRGCQLPWELRVLLAANENLECQYQNNHLACLALRISRNYRLLAEQNVESVSQNTWVEQAERWWHFYQRDTSCSK